MQEKTLLLELGDHEHHERPIEPCTSTYLDIRFETRPKCQQSQTRKRLDQLISDRMSWLQDGIRIMG